MIGMLEGKIIQVNENKVVVLTSSGVGYEVHFPYQMLNNDKVTLFISHIIRENTQDLFGFKDVEDKMTFELLLDVNGVGPKSAYSLVSSLGVDGVRDAILFDRPEILKQAPGIGKKTAEQIILSLRDKVAKEAPVIKKKSIDNTAKENSKMSFDKNKLGECIDAMSALGFDGPEMIGTIKELISGNESKSSQEIIKLALQQMR